MRSYQWKATDEETSQAARLAVHRLNATHHRSEIDFKNKFKNKHHNLVAKKRSILGAFINTAPASSIMLQLCNPKKNNLHKHLRKLVVEILQWKMYPDRCS